MEELLKSLGIAIALGALIGLEREITQREEERIIMGVRTFILMSIAGFLSAFLSSFVSKSFILLGFGMALALGIAGYFVKVSRMQRIGLTTNLAFIITFLIGVLAYFDSYPFLKTVSIGLVVALILAIKEYTRKFAKHVLRKEIRAAIIFGILAFTILPTLPNRVIDPLGLINPRVIWLALILVLGFSFLAYVGMKLYGPRGISIAGALGGLISSTSVTFTMAKKFKERRYSLERVSSAICFASSTMFLRVLIILLLLNLALGICLSIPLLLIGLVGYVLSAVLIRAKKEERISIEMESPLAFKTAIEFTLLFLAVLVLSKFLTKIFGTQVVLPIAFLSGLVSLDAITIFVATSNLPLNLASQSILIACLSNTLFKLILAHLIGGKNISKKIIVPFIAISFLLAISCFTLFV